MLYNVREKSFPDGLIQSTFSKNFRYKGKRKNLGGPAAHGSGLSIERKEIDNMKRAKQMVWDLGRANHFDWWLTLTFSPEQVDDRSDYKCCSDALKKFTRYLYDHRCRWLLVPDWDSHDGVHFHGLFSGDLKFVRAYSPYTGKPLFDNHGRPCYNIADYKLGFTSAVPLDGSPAVITYLTQYYTKNRKMQVPKGCKRYWASRNLIRPAVSYDLRDMMDFLRLRYAGSSFAKNMKSPFGDMIFAETTDDQVMAQLERMGREEAGTYPTQQNKDYFEADDSAPPFCWR